MEERICKKCGAVIAPGMKFCVECGEPAPLEENVPQQEPAAAAAVSAASAPPQTYTPPAQPVQPRRPEPVSAAPGAPQNSGYAGGAAFVPPVAPAGANFTYQNAPQAVDQRPPKGSPYEPISAWGYFGISLLMAVPIIGFIFTVVWACGGCTKINKRNYARSILLALLIGLLLSIVLVVLAAIFGWTDYIVEQYQGYYHIMPYYG